MLTPIGERIRLLRIERRLSVNEFANKSGVSKSYISNIERGVQKNPSLIIMGKLAKTLEVSLEELLTYKYANDNLKNSK
ncbi:XRE family transcriptional regulator, master regulator for biofilm formation [Halobacillus karajensis]|uniref:HTH-type transcriptional regulator SinR n=1 Tax=Halobacillus karajensis TaxID=195088 RepID=A0A059NYG7_9BACI|nr:helix-turn-helix transcriptional regulator [Halobacillus karajensis]CDQ18910.1 HTH-type transcriptional regulator SinR [Halobacillus karajensis]CDQ23017.1 HTH-type transcriptional regulator SinR [Halobacillus karajensis]CDQ26499.1 HTH-type transcriptional regulator SinR [Halobacillus karajensis]SEH44484.1 XRE family transcriptional regulator, master regulator for biofilm formation [Halobacillus karajensis]